MKEQLQLMIEWLLIHSRLGVPCCVTFSGNGSIMFHPSDYSPMKRFLTVESFMEYMNERTTSIDC